MLGGTAIGVFAIAWFALPIADKFGFPDGDVLALLSGVLWVVLAICAWGEWHRGTRRLKGPVGLLCGLVASAVVVLLLNGLCWSVRLGLAGFGS